MLRQLLLLIHLLSVISWVGGMFFAYFCLRPAAVETLDAPSRLKLWVATFARFLPYMSIAVTLLLISGITMLLSVGFQFAPVGWHIMLTLGLFMAGVYLYIYLWLFPQLRRHCVALSWQEAAQALASIRRFVGINISLGVIIVVAAISAR
ncbi:MAG TPA: CopD family protein [Methylophilus sp.]|nr:CopD family protein [Methylophilus sp.]HQQ34011.1 CopD family protein [Methylophilus sp.]